MKSPNVKTQDPTPGSRAPKAFICHASADKERFVFGFTKKLRRKGIDAWLDTWELSPGDSLVDKIFEDGIAQTDVMIVILSNNSVKSKWVREELGVGFLKKIEGKIRLIPITIDRCKVPECLSNVYRVEIDNLNNYDEELKSIVEAIYDRPPVSQPLGKPPKYTCELSSEIQGIDLDSVGITVFRIIYEFSIEHNRPHISTDKIIDDINNQEITEDMFLESLLILKEYELVRLVFSTKKLPIFTETKQFGFDKYLHSFFPNFSELERSIASMIVNDDTRFASNIADSLNVKLIIVWQVLRDFSDKGYLKILSEVTLDSHIYDISPILKRKLNKGLL